MSDLLSLVGARAPDSLIGWRTGKAVTAVALLARVRDWRALAQDIEGDAVALYIDDTLEFAAALLGAWAAGKTVWLSADTLEASCSALARSVHAFLGDFPARWQPRHPVVAAPAREGSPAPFGTRPVLVVHTSGSTGTPQAIPKRMDQLMAEVATLERVFGAAIGMALVVSTVSHQHIYGLLFKVLWPLYAGRPVYATALNYPEQLADVLGRGPSVLVASPAHLKRLPGHLDWRRAHASLHAVFSSGGPLDAEAAAHAGHLLGQVPTEIYGSSETGGIAWRRHQESLPGTWEALPGVAWRIAADGGQLEVASPHLAVEGWLRLEDRAIGAAGGRFMLLGRSDRIVKIEEKRISLDTIEAALLDTGLAQEARAIVCPAVAGQRQALAAFVVPTAAGHALLAGAGKQALNARLRSHLSGVVEAVALPRRWRYLEQMPLNAQGKTTQAQLTALLGGTDDRPRMPHESVLEQDGSRVLLSLSVPANLFYLDGHFTQAPVLPGVVQVDWAIHFARRHFALAGGFRGINALKFQQVICPDMPVQLELTHDAGNGSLQFRYFSDAGQHAGGRILFDSVNESIK